jgi:hypothetical protein
LVSDLAEPALRTQGLFMRPIPFFERYDGFWDTFEKLTPECEHYLEPLKKPTAARVARSYAFAGELSRDVLQNLCPLLSENGERAQCTLWGAAVLLDQILDEDGEDLTRLAPVRDWVRWQAGYGGQAEVRRPQVSSKELNALVSMLEDYFADCHQRGKRASQYAESQPDLLRMLDAELSSTGLSLRSLPDGRVRRIVHDKSVPLCRVGFRSCLLGNRVEPLEMKEYVKLCDAVGEVLWITDDLVDLEEDLDRGVWNRTLCRLYDRLGEVRFRATIRSKEQLAEMVRAERIVERSIHEITERVELLESQPTVKDPGKLRSMLMFWITSWMQIYA